MGLKIDKNAVSSFLKDYYSDAGAIEGLDQFCRPHQLSTSKIGSPAAKNMLLSSYGSQAQANMIYIKLNGIESGHQLIGLGKLGCWPPRNVSNKTISAGSQ